MRTAALATVLVALASQTLAASWASRRAWKSAIAAREPPSFSPEQFSHLLPVNGGGHVILPRSFNPEQFSHLLSANGKPIVISRRQESGLQAREPATLDPEQTLINSITPEFQNQVANNLEHGIIELRRALERNEARARQELAMREYESDLLTSLLEAREFNELD